MESHLKPTLEIHLDAIVRNYQLLKSKGGKGCAAVVKANAYGLGVARVATALFAAGCREFFVATLDEALELRTILPKAIIYVFHGVRKGQEKEFTTHNIIPVINDISQMEYWKSLGSYALHVDTGMCRLGVTVKDLGSLNVDASKLALIMSHLACANEPNNPKNTEQLALFRNALTKLPAAKVSFANSSGIFLGSDYHFDLLRPGCSLYGISPNTKQVNPMENVVTLSAPVLQYRYIDEEQTVGYSASAKATKGMVLATVELGYADGLLRSFSNKLNGYAAGVRVPVIGRVSMDMVSVDVTAVAEQLRNENLRITFIGKEQSVDVVAEAAGTTGYEIFTRLGSRIERLYSSA